ncbi:NAD(P)-binding protein [Aulographum hederae CBS 113979]|uniref:NAD(P)-binding protein n=1 Tax=Aulographum hederae CBS 113979 TaxID=1176131 RepID=A0A6G1H1P2_9PEZI|nr:NAD(P)-binding protein [Aulographum hederae CBS 113979]
MSHTFLSLNGSYHASQLALKHNVASVIPSRNAESRLHRSLEGKLAIVTGASRGIGAAISRTLASKSASIVINYVSDRSKDQAEGLANEFESGYQVKCLAVQADVSKPEGVKTLIEATKAAFSTESGLRIDMLINNAGVARNDHIRDVKVDDFDWMYRINVLGPLLVVQAVEPYLPSDRSGRIVNLSSISSTEGFHGQTVYGGTKAALDSMTRTWARELSERCTVNSINPGPVLTDMWTSMPPSHRNGLKDWMSHTPLAAARKGIDHEELVEQAVDAGGRPAYTSEIAGIVGMLCSEESVWCTGQVICANGGMRMAI